jgi:hypothetical protein
VPIVNAPDGEGALRTTKNLWIDKRSSITYRERDRTMSREIQLLKMKMEKNRVLPRFAGQSSSPDFRRLFVEMVRSN